MRKNFTDSYAATNIWAYFRIVIFIVLFCHSAYQIHWTEVTTSPWHCLNPGVRCEHPTLDTEHGTHIPGNKAGFPPRHDPFGADEYALRNEVDFSLTESYILPNKTAEIYRFASWLDSKMKTQSFCDGPPLSRKFCVFHFWGSHYAEQYLSANSVGNKLQYFQEKLTSFLRVCVEKVPSYTFRHEANPSSSHNILVQRAIGGRYCPAEWLADEWKNTKFLRQRWSVTNILYFHFSAKPRCRIKSLSCLSEQ